MLHLAVSLGYIESAKVLLQHKADVTKENAQGWTGKDNLGCDTFGGRCSLFLHGILVSRQSDTRLWLGFFQFCTRLSAQGIQRWCS